MIEDTIAKIEARLRTAGSLPPEERQELAELLSQLRAEAGSLPLRSEEGADLEDDDVQGVLGRWRNCSANSRRRTRSWWGSSIGSARFWRIWGFECVARFAFRAEARQAPRQVNLSLSREFWETGVLFGLSQEFACCFGEREET
jgi:hypothetical protein